MTKEKEQDNAPSAEKLTTPAKDSKEKEGRKGILNAIRIPLVSSVFSRKRKETDSELGQTGAAGLASVETLDDAANERNPIACEDGMETVRLDVEGADGAEPPTQHPLVVFVSAVKRHRHYLGIIILLIIITCIVCILPKEVRPQQPLKNGKYVETVTWCGPVQGVLEDGAFAFRGIPYALPPINNRRWQTAESVRRIEHCWNGTRLTHSSSEVCWQRQSSGLVVGSEDCLYLDVFTPAVRYDSPLPVVVMIGAETLSGGSPGVMQPSAKLSRVRDIVFVRPNFRILLMRMYSTDKDKSNHCVHHHYPKYAITAISGNDPAGRLLLQKIIYNEKNGVSKLGIFGFLAAEPISKASHPPTSGNYGLSDIIAALQWVQLNIDNFGGNKSSVTLWGHRAGGTLVTTLVGSRRTKGLFSRIWISSGSAIFPGKELDRSEIFAKPFLEALRCANAACLRIKTAEQVIDAVPETWYTKTVGLPETKEVNDKRHEWLVLDGVILQEHIGQILTVENNLPKMVIGTTAHSGTPLQYLQPNVSLNASQVEKIIQESLLGTSGMVTETLKRYNATLKGLVTMISDIRVVCPLFTVASMKNNVPFYVATQPRGQLADPDSDAAAILGTYAAVTPEEKRHVSAMQQLFNYYVWHGEVPQADRSGAKRVLMVGQDTLLERDYPNCDYWIKTGIVPRYGRLD
ncbi:Neurotactin [Harpegnathos saltator]|uniref:Neurotactin n=1 Tax=Harpegnathos saltator TaxID=610380 RepID=E2BI28_HARSA|nr:Neurotactin [Harpegnathos saltator]